MRLMHGIEPSAPEAGQEPECDADEHGQAGGPEGHDERDASPVEQADELVAPEAVGPRTKRAALGSGVIPSGWYGRCMMPMGRPLIAMASGYCVGRRVAGEVLGHGAPTVAATMRISRTTMANTEAPSCMRRRTARRRLLATVTGAAAGSWPIATGEGTVIASPSLAPGGGCGPPRSCPAR